MMIAAAVIALLALPLVVLRGRTLARYYACDAMSWLAAWLLWLRLTDVNPRLAFTALCVAKLAVLFLFIARGRDVCWSAWRAALIAAVIYGVALPQMIRVPIDGDEPYYLLLSESLLHDADVDLANQYATLERTASGRKDLVPHGADPKGNEGEQYSRLEPFLPLLMLPGLALFGLPGAVATIALFGVLLVRSTIRWMEDEGVEDAAIRAVFPFFAFAPPVIFYALRIWPEVPAAFFFVEALRGVRGSRMKRWLPALLGLVLLKLRFVLLAVVLAGAAFRNRVRGRLLLPLVLLVPLAVMWLVVGSPTSVHSLGHLLKSTPAGFVNGFFGTLADGMSGIAFQAPFYLIGLFALTQWRTTPRGFRLGILAALPYLILLFPRAEWWGGWSPPLRYVVFLMPVLALGAAAVWEKVSSGAKGVIAIWTAGLVVHGLVWPWRHFHLFNGEAPVGEWLSAQYGADFSRLIPSFIRVNTAAWLAVPVVLFIIMFGLRRTRFDFTIPLVSLAMAAAFVFGQKPAPLVHFEDAHVRKRGGDMYPERYALIRWFWPGGWILHEGNTLSFLAQKGTHVMHARTGVGAVVELDGRRYRIGPSDDAQQFTVQIRQDGRVTLRCVAGSIFVDRMVHE